MYAVALIEEQNESDSSLAQSGWIALFIIYALFIMVYKEYALEKDFNKTYPGILDDEKSKQVSELALKLWKDNESNKIETINEYIVFLQ